MQQRLKSKRCAPPLPPQSFLRRNEVLTSNQAKKLSKKSLLTKIRTLMVKNGKLLCTRLAHIFKIKKLHEHVTSSNIQNIRILSKLLNLVKQNQGNMDKKCFLQLTSCLIMKQFDTYLDKKRNIVKQGEYVNKKIRALNQFVL